MAVALALLTALAYGSGDFSGGLAARRTAPATVTATSHALGLIGVFATAAIVGSTEVRGPDLLFGAAAGACGCIGVVLLYRGLSTGTMAVVAPISGVTAAVVPVVGGLVAGERPGTAALVGIAVALVAIVLVSHSGPMGRPEASSLLVAFGSGVAFGAFFLLIGQVDEAAGLWPLVVGRAVSMVLAATIALSRGLPVLAPRGALPFALAAGALDVTANVTFLLATQRGLLAIVGVIASLYPAATVLLAMGIEDERLSATQGVGLAAAAGALVLIAV
jgi:drug/metabolite transporter (DMT)-like permease